MISYQIPIDGEKHCATCLKITRSVFFVKLRQAIAFDGMVLSTLGVPIGVCGKCMFTLRSMGYSPEGEHGRILKFKQRGTENEHLGKDALHQ